MVDNCRIRESIKNSGLKYNFIANRLGCTKQTLINKLNGVTEWTVREVQTFANLLQLSFEEIITLFFTHEVKE